MAPNDATALLTWGRMQIIRGRADLALPALEKANRLVPSYPAGHLFIAQALLMRGRTDEVQARVEQAVEMSANEPRRTSNADALGGRTDEAVTALAAFLKLWPGATVARDDDSRRIDPFGLSRAARASLRGPAQGGVAATLTVDPFDPALCFAPFNPVEGSAPE